MKIAVNARFLIPGKMEGLGWYTYDLVSRLVRLHPDWDFVLLYDRPHSSYLVTGPNVTHRVVFPPARHPLLWYLWFEWSLPRVLRKAGADVFFSPDGYLSLRSRVRSIMVLHDLAFVHYPRHIPFLVRAYYRYFSPKFFKRADHIITISDFVRTDLIQHFPVDPAKVSRLYNGCRLGFVPLREKEKQLVRDRYSKGQVYFLYWGALQPRKNVDRLIRAFGQFKESCPSSVKLLIGGRKAWKTEALEQAWQDSHFREDILFTGYLSEEELFQVVAAAHAVVYVSLFEGFGLPLVEAMHAEVPILTSNVTSLPEIAGDAALLINPKSVEDIAAGLKRLYEDPELCRSLVDKGKVQRKKFDWDKAAAELGKVF